MEHIKNILIAVELDNDSEVVLEYGITLGIMLDANVRCLHVTRPLSNQLPNDSEEITVENYGEYVPEDVMTLDKIVEYDHVKLRSLVARVLNKMQIVDHPISTHVIPDFAVQGILKESNETGADLIIVGAHVDYHKKDNAISNLSKRIIEDSNQSVIVVPSTYGNRNLDHICMFINFEFDELDMIKDMIDVVRWNGLHLSFIHILGSNQLVSEAEAKLDVYRRIFLDFEEDPLVAFKMVEGDLTDIIEDLSNDFGVDLLGLRLKKKAWKMFEMEDAFEKIIMDHIKLPLYVWKN